MPIKDYLPFNQAPAPVRTKQASLVEPKTTKKLARIMKATTLALGLSSVYGGRSAFEASPFDFNRIIEAIETDSYAKQAFNKYRELMWMNGWDIVSDNPEAVEYLYQRISLMEITMKQPFQQFLETVADQLVKFHNCFIVKARGDINPFFPSQLRPVGKNEFPVLGYEIVAAETVRIERNAHNKPTKYRQEFDGYGMYSTGNAPEWKPEEVIHLHVDRKPQHLFGTPFMTAVLDDLVSLRQLEEDTLNLTHQELFPFYSVTVGTEEEPAEEEEIVQAAEEIASMRSEGAMVHSERRKVEAIGGEGKALKVEGYLDRFVNRVCAGLGLSPHHLGLMMGGANRSVTDRLDIALYNKVKVYQMYLESAFRVFILNELLLEGGFNPYDREDDLTNFRYQEIDIDTQVKLESHWIQLYANNVITLQELRVRLRLDPDIDEADLLAALMVRLQPDQVVPGKPSTPGGVAPPPTTVDTTPVPAQKDTQTPSTGGRPNAKNTARSAGNQVRPQNQHRRRTSPNIRHDDTLDTLVELLDDNEEF